MPDVAYHVTKWERGFHRAINVQGADHHSTVTRVRAGLQALDIGIPEGYPEYVLHQMVTVMKGGEEVKISKRAGSYVTVRDLIDEVGRDAVRYFFLMRKGDSQLVFDVDLARSQSEENPVYYIQMAHARMSGIFRVGEIDAGVGHRRRRATWACLAEPEERELIKALLDCPDARRRAPPTRSSRTASPTTCTRRRGWCTSGTTSTTCSASPSRSCTRGSCSRARGRIANALACSESALGAHARASTDAGAHVNDAPIDASP